MKKGIYILGILAFALAVTGCEKCEKPMFTDDPFINASDRSHEDEDSGIVSTRNEESIEGDHHGDGSASGGITDPNKDPDYDGIVDPDKDEDFDKDDDGK